MAKSEFASTDSLRSLAGRFTLGGGSVECLTGAVRPISGVCIGRLPTVSISKDKEN